MPILPSGGARFIEQNGASAPMVTLLVLHLAVDGIYDFIDVGTGSADAELVDVTGTGVFDVVAAGTSPSAPRARSQRLGGSANAIIY